VLQQGDVISRRIARTKRWGGQVIAGRGRAREALCANEGRSAAQKGPRWINVHVGEWIRPASKVTVARSRKPVDRCEKSMSPRPRPGGLSHGRSPGRQEVPWAWRVRGAACKPGHLECGGQLTPARARKGAAKPHRRWKIRTVAPGCGGAPEPQRRPGETVTSPKNRRGVATAAMRAPQAGAHHRRQEAWRPA